MRQFASMSIAALSALVIAVAMATTPAMAQTGQGQAAQIRDPWMRLNRRAYGFSMATDRAVIAPVVRAYIKAMPQPVRAGLSNAVANLNEPRTAGNDILQGRFKRAGAATARFAINSVVGIAGLIDVAGNVGIQRHESDFGQTLGRYGISSGPYLFVPFAGPSSVRDSFGRLIDVFADPVMVAAGGIDTTFGQVRTGVAVVDARVAVDDQMRALEHDFTDPYAAIRGAYAQQRANAIDVARGKTAASKIQDLPDFDSEPQASPASSRTDPVPAEPKS
jgi:phospholipid-binding lipoprotein MlaA